jgi:small conductance mechanosensitive channel
MYMMDLMMRLGIERDEFVNTLWSYVPNLIMAAFATLATIIFYKVTAKVIEATLLKTAMQPSLVHITVHSLYKWIVGTIGFIFVLGLLGINVSAALAGVGVASLAIGFAAKETLANFMAGFGIFIDRLYKKGDWVKIGGEYGEVKEITLRTTKIRTLDNVFINMPNSLITSLPITNYSEEGMIRISIKIGIALNESIDAVRNILLGAVKRVEGAYTDPAPQVVLDHIDDSTLNILVRVWIPDAGKEPIFKFALTEACKKALDEAGIELPVPQQEVKLKKE